MPFISQHFYIAANLISIVCYTSSAMSDNQNRQYLTRFSHFRAAIQRGPRTVNQNGDRSKHFAQRLLHSLRAIGKGISDRNDDYDEKEQLCPRCKALDISRILNMSIERPCGEECIIDLGLIPREMDTALCPLCRLLAAVCPPDRGRGDRFKLRAFDKYSPRETTTGARMIPLDPNSARAGIVLSVETGSGYFLPGHEFGAFIALAQNRRWTPDEPFQCSGMVVNSKITQYDPLREWIRQCQETHTGTCRLASPHHLRTMKVIDCFTRTVVPFSFGDEYFALRYDKKNCNYLVKLRSYFSYVWGSTNTDDNFEKSSRLSAVPLVIEDAMTVVKNLGRRYLWVDRYCILNQEDKHIQIQDMHHIYEGATVTIVAVAGERAEDGLPGVSSVLRLPQPSAVVRKHKLVSTLPPLCGLLEKSKWSSRGWTYQECLLSRRCLFFTDWQVYFLCKGMTRCEAIDPPLGFENDLEGRYAASLGPHIFTEDSYHSYLEDSWYSKENQFPLHLAEYTSRSLSFPSDAVNAFRGILAKFRLFSYWGIPILPPDRLGEKEFASANTGFAVGLIWVSDRHRPDRIGYSTLRRSVSRRDGFPSWSWASVEGPTRYHNIDLFAADGRGNPVFQPKRTHSSARFSIEIRAAGFVPLPHVLSYLATPQAIPEDFHALQVEVDVFQVYLMPNNSYDMLGPFMFWVDGAHGFMTVDQDYWEHGRYHQELLSKKWDAAILLEYTDMSNWGSSKVIIIDYHGTTTRRIGCGTVWGDLSAIPRERKRILLK